MTRWFEDIVIDEVFPLGSHTLPPPHSHAKTLVDV